MSENRKRLSNELSSQFEKDDNQDVPLVLIELSKKEWEEQKPTSIHLTNPIIINTHSSNHKQYNRIHYSNIEYGSELFDKRNEFKGKDISCNIKVNTDESFVAKEIFLNRIKKNKLLITTTKIDIEKISENNIYTTSTKASSNPSPTFQPSGIIVVSVIKHLTPQPNKNPQPTNSSLPSDKSSFWLQSIFEDLTFCKENIIKK